MSNCNKFTKHFTVHGELYSKKVSTEAGTSGYKVLLLAVLHFCSCSSNRFVLSAEVLYTKFTFDEHSVLAHSTQDLRAQSWSTDLCNRSVICKPTPNIYCKL